MQIKNKKTVSLVLGSGAARGLAHIGVIDALEEQGFEIVSIAGCSIGAIIGGAYATGRFHAFRQWASGLTRLETVRLIDISIANAGAIKGDKLFSKIKDIIGDPNIEDLNISFTSIATDLINQKESWFQSGSLINALRASSAIPSLILPVRLGDKVYVDGGLLNPLPIIPTIAANADYIVAVDLNGSQAMPNLNIQQPQESSEDWVTNIRDMFKANVLDNFEDLLADKVASQGDKKSLDTEHLPENWGRLQIINTMFETMQASLTQYKVAGYPPDAVVSLSKDACSFYEFWRADEMIEYGYQETIKVLNHLEEIG
jgi:NTE family protein